VVRKKDDKANAQTVAEALARALARHGIDTVFGQSIPSLLFLATPKHGIRQVMYRTENAGAVMADGYARISGRVGVLAAQNGPAATLLVPGLAEAMKASIPVLAIVQDVALANMDRNAFQELDHLDLFKGTAKWIRRLNVPERVDDYVDMALVAATSGRPGPAVLLVPYDLLGKPCMPSSERLERLGTYPLDRVAADPGQIELAAKLLADAEAPLVIAGGGVHLSGAADALARLQEAASLPVATTTMGKGSVDEGHPLSVGVVGYFMGEGAAARHLRPLIDRADTILLVGNRTNQNGTDSWTLLPRGARLIHQDIDGEEVGRNYEAERLVGDAKLTIHSLTAALARLDLKKRKAARPAVEKAIAEGRRKHRAEVAGLLGADILRPEQLVHALDQLLSPDDIVVADAPASGSSRRAASPASAGVCRSRSEQSSLRRTRASSASRAMGALRMSGRSSRPCGAWVRTWCSPSSATRSSATRSTPRRSSTARIRMRCSSPPSIMRQSHGPAGSRAFVYRRAPPMQRSLRQPSTADPQPSSKR
jgi:acetolactate synthase-1/2/3 large subunit